MSKAIELGNEWKHGDRKSRGTKQIGDEMAEELRRLDAENAALRAQLKGEPVAWRDVVGFEGVYSVSSSGDIKNIKTGKILSKSLMGAGYIKADLWKDGKKTQTSHHRVVAQAFIDNPEGFNQVNHINGIKSDNRFSNLEWCSKSQDHLHKYYELGKVAKPVEAINIETNEVVFYPSITQATRDGFASSHIYRCISGELSQVNGWTFRRPEITAPQQAPACNHRIVDARNPIVKSGYLCVDCGAVFAAADHAQQAPVGERDNFEKAMAHRQSLIKDFTFTLDTYLGEYVSNKVQAQWEGWQARAKFGK